MQELEIEKRYLISSDQLETIKPKIIPGTAVRMNDFYVPNGDRHKDLRLRQKGSQYMITRKTPIEKGDTTTMLETTIPLSEEEFAAMTSNISTNVEKTRYLVDLAGRKGELDVFEGRHAGLVILEFEFANLDDLTQFEENSGTHWPDITNLEWLASGRLAETNASELSERLAELQ